MKKIILIIALTFVSSAAMAEWTFVSNMSLASGKAKKYIDIQSIIKKGNLVTVWELDDYINARYAEGIRYRSGKVQTEYNCSTRTYRMGYMVIYSEPMGKGRVLYQGYSNSKAIPVIPDTVSMATLEIACMR
jgi:hypothetical protein